MMTTLDDLSEIVERLNRYGRARNRMVDHEPRTIGITDDEALVIVMALTEPKHAE